MHGYDMMSGWGGMWFGPFGMVLGTVLLVLVVVWLVRAMSGDGSAPRSDRRLTPRQILDERFAKGEIDEEEYKRRRSAIDS